MSAAAVTMPAPLALRPLLAAAALLLAMAAVAQTAERARETERLSEKEYPMQLEEVVVRAQQPQWREKEVAPDFNREKFKFEPDVKPSRLQAFPKYDRDERDNYDQVRDRMNAKPEIKLFEFKF